MTAVVYPRRVDFAHWLRQQSATINSTLLPMRLSSREKVHLTPTIRMCERISIHMILIHMCISDASLLMFGRNHRRPTNRTVSSAGTTLHGKVPIISTACDARLAGVYAHRHPPAYVSKKVRTSPFFTKCEELSRPRLSGAMHCMRW